MKIVIECCSVKWNGSMCGIIILYIVRMQANRPGGADAYRGMSDVFLKTYQNEGARGFYKGLFPNLLKVVPAASITYMVYEAMKKTLDLEWWWWWEVRIKRF